MTEYCVHHLPAPTSDKYLAKDGFAAYLSCNGMCGEGRRGEEARGEEREGARPNNFVVCMCRR
jgi:hypothetical protein